MGLGAPEFWEKLKTFEELHGEEAAQRIGLPVDGRHFAELLLLSLIRGNRLRASGVRKETPPGTDLERLTAAYVAIFGTPPNEYANHREDWKALEWMAEMKSSQLRARVANPAATKPDSDVILARKAVAIFSSHPLDSDGEFSHTRARLSGEEHLRKKFRTFWEEWTEKSQSVANIEADISLLQKLALDEIEKICARFGVPMQWEP